MKDLKTEINSNPNGLKAKIYDTYVEGFVEQFETTEGGDFSDDFNDDFNIGEESIENTINASVNNFRSDINYGACKITVADVFNPTPELSGDVTEFKYKKIVFKYFKEFVNRYDGCSFFIVSNKIKVLENEELQDDKFYKIPKKILFKFYKDFPINLSSLFKMNDGIETISINGKKHQISDDYTFKVGTDYYIS